MKSQKFYGRNGEEALVDPLMFGRADF